MPIAEIRVDGIYCNARPDVISSIAEALTVELRIAFSKTLENNLYWGYQIVDILKILISTYS